ncbi:aldose epimerase family protein [Hymenobacter sp. B81]|uniref:aldose epimerase family protein n=1 Tax=Hymenobacter sp. B81 TaxID=3344878 RepID=UPI0037DC5742
MSTSFPLSLAPFGRTPEGQAVELYTLGDPAGPHACISTYGGTVTRLLVPDQRGQMGDVVLGFDALDDYLSEAYRQANPYFGALIGRYANRLARGRFALDGQHYQLATNNGPNHLHGGHRGFDRVVWQAEALPGSATEARLRLRYRSPDGEEGYPGNLQVEVTYRFGADLTLRIEYRASTDRTTPLNLTNHSYFNLAPGSPDVLGHELQLPAERYTVVDDTLIPTGELRPVNGTPMDFRRPHPIGARIGQVAGGYDHNWVLPDEPGLRLAARVQEPASGRRLEVYTDQPGVQFYSGNFLDGSLRGKNGVVYGRHTGFCLETQHFPDSPNHPQFPGTILRPGTEFHSVTEYRFGLIPGQ